MQSFKPVKVLKNPREASSILSTLMFCFVMPIFFKGHKKKLDTCDLYEALDEHKSGYLGEKLTNAWEEECLRKQTKHLTPSLLVTLARIFGLRFALFGVILFILEIGLRVTQPLFLGGLVSHYSKTFTTDKTEKNNGYNQERIDAYLYAFGIIVCNAGNVLFMHPFMLGVQHIGMKIRVSVTSMIYRKTLRLSKTALRNITNGQVANLIANDVSRLDTSVAHMHYLWLGPVEILIITFLMYREIGASSLYGVSLMIFFLPLQAYLSKKTSALRLLVTYYTDKRVSLMSEIISGIKLIKMYAWEQSFSHLIDAVRSKELNTIKHINYIRGILQSFILFVTRLSVFASLVGYALLGEILTAEKAFIITAYYNILRTTMTIYFPMGITQFTEFLISIQRIEKYMMLHEVKIRQNQYQYQSKEMCNGTDKLVTLNGLMQSIGINRSLSDKTNHNDDWILNVNKLRAKWDNKLIDYTLDNINMKIKNKSLVAITGRIGAGKSSLIQAILGELPLESGTVMVRGALSYASQEPWVFKGTIRQNILFGLPMDKDRYRLVLQKCALQRDIELMPYGDRTIIGERGASLSGGQKARINLARAVYRNANVYLLDDPLAALDTNVGRHVFEECVCDLLNNDVVIFVTHQFQFLERADLIVLMDKGRITTLGSYESLSKTDLEFAKLLATHDSNTKTELFPMADGNCKRDAYRQKGNKISELHGDSMSSRGSSIEDRTETCPNDQMVTNNNKILIKSYFASGGGGYWLFSIMLVFCVGAQVFASGGDYFLSYWVNKNNHHTYRTDSDASDLRDFTIIHIGVVVLAISRSLLFFNLAKRSSFIIHNKMFRGVIGTGMHFFYKNPMDRILNCFSNDLNQVDELIPRLLMDVIQLLLALCGIVVVLCLVNMWYLISTIFISSIFYFLRAFYLNTSRDIKRLEAINRSPICSHLSASLNGLSTIRAFNAEQLLITEFDNYQDLHSSVYYMLLATNRAFGYWLDCCCAFYIAFITFSFFASSSQTGGDIGLSITQAMSLTSMVQWSMRQSADLENSLTVIERVNEYKELQPECNEKCSLNRKPPKSWPEHGNIVFHNLSLRYSLNPTSEYVLKSLNFEVKSHEKVGIVGRTGAGKSSLINALFNLAYNDGSIIIDMWDTRDIALQELRNKISIIPQEPVLFSGTIRFNLDPFNEYTDTKLWEALEKVKMKNVISELPSGMHSKLSEGGTNFSVGQRQLICLARAILRENRILVMDEATANVDPQTDALIQTTIRDKFKQCTVLTIAHRLHTVMDSDKVLVLEAGRIIEYGSPYELLTMSKTKVFYGMVQQMGDTYLDNFLKIAQKAHEENLKMKRDSCSQMIMVPKVFKDYILKILEPITNHPTNVKIQNSKLFLDHAKPKFLG